jgi:hypothetical protein
MIRARPLRFLALVVCAWVGARTLILNLPGSAKDRRPAAAAALPPAPTAILLPRFPPSPTTPATPAITRSLIRNMSYKTQREPHLSRAGAPPVAAVASLRTPIPTVAGLVEAPAEPAATAWSLALPIPAAAPPGRTRRWSSSAWLLLRDDRGEAALAPGGTLGGSQAGARFAYRVGGGLALSARAYLPLRRRRGAEIAAGVDWQPVARLPLHLLAERRQDAGGAGRSAFALTLYGGASGRLPAGLRAEAYAQAGVVGTRSRDAFVDGAARVALPTGPVEVGGGVWGAAQPGSARLDAGPAVTYRLPIRGAALRIEAGWRFRVVGDAVPGSGPALTVAADF